MPQNQTSYVNQPPFYTNSSQQQAYPRQSNDQITYTTKESLPAYEEAPPPYGFQA
jgi:hypothetical protein